MPEKAGSAGRACVEDAVRVVRVYPDRVADPADLAAQDGCEVGEVIIRSAAKAAEGYTGNPEETKCRFRDGFFYTHDLAVWDAQGFLRIVGRLDDMILSGGENIYPAEVEEILQGHPLVADCMITAVSDSLRGELVTAYVVPLTASLTAQQLDLFCKSCNQLADYKRPRYYCFVSELPRNAAGKKLHRVMRQQAEQDSLAGRLIRC